MHYLHLAARRGEPEADYAIAHDLFWDDERSRQNGGLAYVHARLARFGQVPQAFGLLGKAHEEGIGCKKNLVLAEKYYYEGGKKKDGWARARSDALRNQGIGVDGNERQYHR
jgi:TPR repeat protein